MTTLPSGDALAAMRQVALTTLAPHVPRGVIVYGSFGRHLQGPTSDLDVLFIGHSTPRALAALTSALVDFSHRHGLALDEEVPYANKLLVDWDELTAASSCEVFTGSPRLTPVQRGDRAYLASEYMRNRLFVTGVLAQRTLDWCESNPVRLDLLRSHAGKSLAGAAIDDIVSSGREPDTEVVVAYLTGEDQHIPAGDWLGFDSDRATKEHLHVHAERALASRRPFATT